MDAYSTTDEYKTEYYLGYANVTITDVFKGQIDPIKPIKPIKLIKLIKHPLTIYRSI